MLTVSPVFVARVRARGRASCTTSSRAVVALPTLAFGGTGDPDQPAIIAGNEILTAAYPASTSLTAAGPLTVVTHDATGRALVPDSRPTVPGFGGLVDHDPATGDNLFETEDIACEIAQGDHGRTCNETILRVHPDGTLASQVEVPIGDVQVNPTRPVFGPDGPDADTARDVYFVRAGRKNSESGTIVQPDDLPRTIREVRGGRVEFRNDKTGLLHVAVGKISFSEQQIQDNIAALMEAVKAAKPSAAMTYRCSAAIRSGVSQSSLR